MSTGFNEGGDKEMLPQVVHLATNQLLDELSYIDNISVVTPIKYSPHSAFIELDNVIDPRNTLRSIQPIIDLVKEMYSDVEIEYDFVTLSILVTIKAQELDRQLMFENLNDLKDKIYELLTDNGYTPLTLPTEIGGVVFTLEKITLDLGLATSIKALEKSVPGYEVLVIIDEHASTITITPRSIDN